MAQVKCKSTPPRVSSSINHPFSISHLYRPFLFHRFSNWFSLPEALSDPFVFGIDPKLIPLPLCNSQSLCPHPCPENLKHLIPFPEIVIPFTSPPPFVACKIFISPPYSISFIVSEIVPVWSGWWDSVIFWEVSLFDSFLYACCIDWFKGSYQVLHFGDRWAVL